MIARRQGRVNQIRDLLAEEVVDCDLDIGRLGPAVLDRCGGVEGVGVMILNNVLIC